MMRSLRTVRHVFGALYTWSAAVFFGAVLLDVVYASLLGVVDESLTQPVFGEVSDFLLVLGAFSLLAGLAAIALAWNVPLARNLFALSLLVLAVSEFLVPIVLFPLLRATPDSSVLGITPYVRLVPLALASLLALGGLWALFLESLPPGL